MRIVAQFDPSQKTSDTFNAGFANGTGKMVVYNESNINLKLAWGTFTTYCPAWMACLYCVSTNNVNIQWAQQSTLASNGSPLSQVLIEAYDANEPVIGTFPAALVRQTNIGNSVSTNVTSTGAIVNDGNPSNTSIIEATVSGDSSSAVKLSNDAIMTLGDTAHPGSLTVAGPINAAASTDLVENVPTGQAIRLKVNSVEEAHFTVNGLIVVPGKLGQTADGDIIDAGGNDTYLKSRSTGVIHHQVPDGTSIYKDTSTGIASERGASNFDIDSAGTGFIRLLVNGTDVLDATNSGPRLGTGMTMRFVSGTMSRQQGGHSASISGVTITHGLGATPALVLITTDITQPGSATVGTGSVGSTTFVATVGSGSGFYWWCLAG